MHNTVLQDHRVGCENLLRIYLASCSASLGGYERALHMTSLDGGWVTAFPYPQRIRLLGRCLQGVERTTKWATSFTSDACVHFAGQTRVW